MTKTKRSSTKKPALRLRPVDGLLEDVALAVPVGWMEVLARPVRQTRDFSRGDARPVPADTSRAEAERRWSRRSSLGGWETTRRGSF